jgi:hypothetical protein
VPPQVSVISRSRDRLQSQSVRIEALLRGGDWIADDVRSDEDAACLGVSGRHVHDDAPRRHSPLLALVFPTTLSRVHDALF